MDFDIDNEKIQIVKDGRTIDCDILFYFESEDTMKAYIGFTDNSFENGRKNIYVQAISALDPEAGLQDITDERELLMVFDALEEMESMANEN